MTILLWLLIALVIVAVGLAVWCVLRWRERRRLEALAAMAAVVSGWDDPYWRLLNFL